MKRRVLLIAYDFPPVGGAGTLRPTRWAKHLPSFGWHPVVLTTERGRLAPYDPSLLHKLHDAEIHRTRAFSPFSAWARIRSTFGATFTPETEHARSVDERPSAWRPSAWMVPDAKVMWLAAGATWARRTPEARCDVVLSTIPTPTAAMIGRNISRLWHVPHVVDYRDPWSDAYYMPHRLPPFRRLETGIEKRIVAQAAAITVAWDGILDEIRRAGGSLPSVTEVILNGYDEEDFVSEPRPTSGVVPQIAHVGILYQPSALRSLARALARLHAEDSAILEGVRFVQIGPISQNVRSILRQMEQYVDVVLRGRLPHAEALEIMRTADMLFLPTFRNIVRGKTGEYLRTGKPVLAISDDGTSTRQLLEDLGAGRLFLEDDIGAIARFVARSLVRRSRPPRPLSAELGKLSSREGTRRLAAILDRVVA